MTRGSSLAFLPGNTTTLWSDDDTSSVVVDDFVLSTDRRRVNREVVDRTGCCYTSTVSIPTDSRIVRRRALLHDLFDQLWLRADTEFRAPRRRGEVRSADLFCGCGGLSLGAREACRALGLEFRSVLAVDADEAAMSVYRSNFSPKVSVTGDARTLMGKPKARLTLREKELQSSCGKVDILLAAPPCQGHSNLNNHTRHQDDRNDLYQLVSRLTKVLQPTSIVIENVPQVIHDRGDNARKAFDELRRMGYVVDEGVVDAMDIGVPQSRKRHIVLASKNRQPSLDDAVDRYRTPDPRSLRWAIREIEDRTSESLLDARSELSEENMKRIRYLFEHKTYDLPNEMRPRCHHEDHSYKAMYGRLHYGEPTQTITAGFFSPGQGRYIHPSRRRTLTAREAARVQFFPDSFDFSAAPSRRDLARLIGNAVPSKLGYVLALEMLRHETVRQPG